VLFKPNTIETVVLNKMCQAYNDFRFCYWRSSLLTR